MSTNLNKRLERLESEPVIASRLVRPAYSGPCDSCAAHFYFMAALERYEREHGLYVKPAPEDVIFLECRQCGEPWPADVRGYTEEERDLMMRENKEDDPEAYMRLSVELNAVIERCGIAMWGHKHFWARSEVGWQALKEITGVDVRPEWEEARRLLKL